MVKGYVVRTAIFCLLSGSGAIAQTTVSSTQIEDPIFAEDQLWEVILPDMSGEYFVGPRVNEIQETVFYKEMDSDTTGPLFFAVFQYDPLDSDPEFISFSKRYADDNMDIFCTVRATGKVEIGNIVNGVFSKYDERDKRLNYIYTGEPQDLPSCSLKRIK